MLSQGEQLTLYDPDLDTWCGRTSPALLVRKRAKISARSLKKPSELRTADYLYLDLRAGYGNMLGPYWAINSHLLGEYWTLNTGESPNAAVESTLSQILEATPHRKYYLSKTACLGILRRAAERGKELPDQLKVALEIQAGLRRHAQRKQNRLIAFHINQREETIDLNGISGALLATANMQMQTFIAQPDDNEAEGSKHGEINHTAGGSAVVSTLFAGYGTRWNGNAGAYSGDHFIPQPLAFAANQRDEVRDLGERAGTIQAQPGMKQQTFIVAPPSAADCLTPWDRQQDRIHNPDGVACTLAGADGGGGRNPAGVVFAAGFCAGAAPSAGGIGYQEECAPTLKAAESGTNMIPSILCLNDQGGQCMAVLNDQCGTLRAQMNGHPPIVMATQQGGAEIGEGICPTITASAGMSGNNQPVLFENHGIDSRYTGPHAVAPTMSARYGTGGNNVPLVSGEPDESFCIAGNIIDREVKNGGNGFGYQRSISYTLNTADRHAVFCRQRSDEFVDSGAAATQSASQHKGATDLVCEVEVFGQSQYANYNAGCTTLRSQGGDNGGGSENLIVTPENEMHNLIRRLTPLECERLQGFPDKWTDIPGASDSARYKALGNSVAIPCVEFVMRGLAYFLKKTA